MKKFLFAIIALAIFAIPAMAQDDTILAVDEQMMMEAPESETAEAPAAAPAEEAAAPAVEAEAPARMEFIVFSDKFNVNNHYIPSGWMGDYGDIAIDDGSRDTPHGGRTCLKITYTAKGSQGAGWMGIYWQNPANNWGTQMGGYDLTPYKKLTFWAKGAKGGEVINEFKVGGITGTYSDSDSTSIGPITLGTDWKQYEIDLKGLDLSYISGGFEMSATSKDNPQGFVIYLDDIKYEG